MENKDLRFRFSEGSAILKLPAEALEGLTEDEVEDVLSALREDTRQRIVAAHAWKALTAGIGAAGSLTIGAHPPRTEGGTPTAHRLKLAAGGRPPTSAGTLVHGRRTSDADPASGRATMSVEEAGRLLGISRGMAYQGVREYLHTGGASGIPAIRLGRRILIPTAELRRLLGDRG